MSSNQLEEIYAILMEFVSTKVYGSLTVKFENGEVVILEELKKRKLKTKLSK